MRNFLFLTFLLCLPAAALAQNDNGLTAAGGTIITSALASPPCVTCAADPPKTHISASLGIHAVANNAASAGAATKSNIGVNVSVGVSVGYYSLNAEAFSGDANQTRARYSATYGFHYGRFLLRPGGGAYRFGNETGGFGHLGVDYGEYKFLFRAGHPNFYEAEVLYHFDLSKSFGFQPFFRYTRHSVAGVNTRMAQFGMRATFGN